jgi:hypothetical protein
MSLIRPAALLLLLSSVLLARAGGPVGADATAGCRESPQVVDRLQIEEPGTYENYLVDSAWAGGNRVKITASSVVLRHCEIRNATGNGVGVFAGDVRIESCRIHHLLNSTYSEQHDAHGITGRPNGLVVRNCEIYHVSGDCLQFDPGRAPWDAVLVENCTLWTGPLPADAAGFKAGERPGENAFDSKTPAEGPRCRIVFRNCLFYGWNQPGQVSTLAALNLKENVDATIENCVFRNNQVALRLRGPGSHGGARVTIRDCAVFDTAVAVRMEDGLENLTIDSLGFGDGVERRFHEVGDGPWPGFTNTGPRTLGSFEEYVRQR